MQYTGFPVFTKNVKQVFLPDAFYIVSIIMLEPFNLDIFVPLGALRLNQVVPYHIALYIKVQYSNMVWKSNYFRAPRVFLLLLLSCLCVAMSLWRNQ